MKKRISCKVIKSIPLHFEDVISSDGDTLKVRKFSSFLNFQNAKSNPVIYTNTMQVSNDSLNDNLTRPSIDFYA